MAQAGSGSFLANAANRRRALNKVRQDLLDRPGIARTGGPPPPTAPAQDRTSPQEDALQQGRPQPPLKMQGEEAVPTEEEQQTETPQRLFDDETRGRLAKQIEPFLQQVQKQKMAQLHRRVGRIRRFWGSGI